MTAMSSPPDLARDIAVEVDRLVIAVHRRVMATHRDHLTALLDGLSDGGQPLDRPGYIYDVAEFIADGRCTDEVVRRRFIYDEVGAATLVPQLVDRRLLDPDGRAAPQLLTAATEMLALRARAADDLWLTDLALADQGAATVLAAAEGPLAMAFATLPKPEEPAARLHHLLTGVRYLRLDAHVDAWRSRGLRPAEVVALTIARDGDGVASPPAGLIGRGWLDTDGQITDAGVEARLEIENGTNRRCGELIKTVADPAAWLAALRCLTDGD